MSSPPLIRFQLVSSLVSRFPTRVVHDSCRFRIGATRDPVGSRSGHLWLSFVLDLVPWHSCTSATRSTVRHLLYFQRETINIAQCVKSKATYLRIKREAQVKITLSHHKLSRDGSVQRRVLRSQGASARRSRAGRVKKIGRRAEAQALVVLGEGLETNDRSCHVA